MLRTQHQEHTHILCVRISDVLFVIIKHIVIVNPCVPYKMNLHHTTPHIRAYTHLGFSTDVQWLIMLYTFMKSSGKARIMHFYIANAHGITLQMCGVSSHKLCIP